MTHRTIAESVLGRALRENEVVHHIDMDKTNNSHDNLIICQRLYHLFLHQRMQEEWARRYRASRIA